MNKKADQTFHQRLWAAQVWKTRVNSRREHERPSKVGRRIGGRCGD